VPPLAQPHPPLAPTAPVAPEPSDSVINNSSSNGTATATAGTSPAVL
jgi:hypothetical protein